MLMLQSTSLKLLVLFDKIIALKFQLGNMLPLGLTQKHNTNSHRIMGYIPISKNKDDTRKAL